ncbi:aminoacyl-tRNA hydrolase [Marinicauda pacifica]|jgi:ribosome-associated protein|uniref:Aminoacyl-tRNA hydrolase n=1 Tax=Marinicauda pacifica TaxID=1133559 RepID=A0A4S2HE94_9PROT|nr:alternative ribosome rescue aminoacyl-tRNA hydrolase ArfB [Marinicauda pacifica]TGY94326.1 aminoacyl-tRNA hydrolase [Marinicauda pacifica]GGE34899.1 aminoacyl-tRNA hydrolase [Marinicauda pacifica]
MRITETLAIDESEIEERFVRASGPGGQHVNTTSSAVQLRFDVKGSPSLPDAVKHRLMRLAGSRMTKTGELIIQADGERSQARNREAARERLKALLIAATKTPKPRKKSRPSLSSVRRQKQAKKQRSDKKALRRTPRAE